MHSKTKTPSRLYQHVTSSFYTRPGITLAIVPVLARHHIASQCSGPSRCSPFALQVPGTRTPAVGRPSKLRSSGSSVSGQGCRLDLAPRTTSPRALLSGRRPYPGSTQTGSGSDLIIARRSFMQRQTPNQHLPVPHLQRATGYAHCRRLLGRVSAPKTLSVGSLTAVGTTTDRPLDSMQGFPPFQVRTDSTSRSMLPGYITSSPPITTVRTTWYIINSELHIFIHQPQPNM